MDLATRTASPAELFTRSLRCTSPAFPRHHTNLDRLVQRPSNPFQEPEGIALEIVILEISDDAFGDADPPRRAQKAKRMAAKLQPRRILPTIRVGLKPPDWLKPAAVTFSGLLGGGRPTDRS